MQNNSVIIPKSIDFELKSEVFKNFRCQAVANSVDLDTKKKSIHRLKIDNINIPDNWNIGLIYGASGSGKTTLAKHIFGENIFKAILNENEPIINQFNEKYSVDECQEMLTGIGLNSVPCWVRPVKTLSNGQRARAEAALLMSSDAEIICIDEWTSVVDRTVASAMSHCIQKFSRKYNKKIILLSCHYDIIEWVKPDWLIDCNKQEFFLPQDEEFFFQRRSELEFTIRKVGRESWRYFSKYHYLSEKLPGGSIFTFGLFHGENQIGFQCWANYVPDVKGKGRIYHFNRTVIHPDFQGLGLGIKLINETARIMNENNPSWKLMGKFSSIPVYKAMRKQKQWKFIGEKRLMKKMGHGKNIRASGFRDRGIRTFHFQYVPLSGSER